LWKEKGKKRKKDYQKKQVKQNKKDDTQ